MKLIKNLGRRQQANSSFGEGLNDNFINYIMWTSIYLCIVSKLLRKWYWSIINIIARVIIPWSKNSRLCINVDNPTFLHFRSPHQLFEFIGCSDKLFDVINSVSGHSCSILLYSKINKRVKSNSNKNI
jgi:hypothetical protein